MKCGQVNCDAEAVSRVFWPGRDPLPSCEEHARRARGIAAAMGFSVTVQPLDPVLVFLNDRADAAMAALTPREREVVEARARQLDGEGEGGNP